MKRILLIGFVSFALLLESCGSDKEKQAETDSIKTDTSFIHYPLTKNKDTLRIYLAKTGADSHRVNVMNGLAWQLSRKDPDSTLILERASLALAQQLQFKTGIGRAYHNMGYAYSLKGEYDTAMYFVKLAKAIFDSTGFINGQISANNTLGGIYNEKGDYENALSCYLQVSQMAEEAGNVQGRISALSNMGLLYSYTKKYEEALLNLRKALSISRSKNLRTIESACLVNMGKVFGDMGNYDSALFYNTLAFDIKVAAEDKNGMATILLNNAQIYTTKHDYVHARENNEAAYRLQLEIDDKRGGAITLLSIAQVQSEQSDFTSAIENVKKAIAVAQTIGAMDVSMEAYDKLATVYSKSGDFKNAFLAHKLFSSLRDSILGEESDRNITEMKTKYESDKKDKAIALLEKDKMLQDAVIEKKNSEAKRRTIILATTLCGLLLVLAFAIFIFFSLKRNQRLNLILGQKNTLIEEKNKNITDSIHYARRIQRALLTSEKYLKKNLPDHFIFNRPKDIVSGDFYWCTKANDGKIFFVTADCTGHGVPGAFMSLIGVSFLNEIVNDRKISAPASILNELRNEIIHALNPDNEPENGDQHDSTRVMDGMDMTICCLNTSTLELIFAAANNPVWICRDRQMLVYPADKMPVGKHEGEIRPFTETTVQLQKGDIVYTFSDGYADQFGGPQGKKFKYKQLQQVLIDVAELPLSRQMEKLDHVFTQWKGNLEQIDDVLLVGIKI